jgi:hypothetical protein
MKTAYAAVICILALLFSACVTGDEITSYVIDPDGSVAFSIYRLNLTSDATDGKKAKEELANYIQELEEKRGDFFTKLVKANAKEVKATILRKVSPASVLITGCIPSLNDFAAYISEKDEEGSLVWTPISRECARGFLIEWTALKPPKEKALPEPVKPRADSFSEMRFALAEGSFTKARGFLIAHDKRSALLDMDTISKMGNWEIPSATLSLEWEIPEAP